MSSNWSIRRTSGTPATASVNSARCRNIRVGSAQPEPVPTLDVLDLIVKALGARDAWVAERGAAAGPRVRTKTVAPAAGDVLVQPFGVLAASQRAAPLDVPIEHVGNAVPVGGTVTAHVTGVTVGGVPVAHSDTREPFAPGQFQNLSDADRLSRRPFEPLVSGTRIDGSGLFKARAPVGREVAYDPTIIDRAGNRSPMAKVSLHVGDFMSLMDGNAVARSPLAVDKAQQAVGPKLKVAEESYTVVWGETLSPAHGAATRGTQTEALAHLRDLERLNPAQVGRLQVVPSWEAKVA